MIKPRAELCIAPPASLFSMLLEFQLNSPTACLLLGSLTNGQLAGVGEALAILFWWVEVAKICTAAMAANKLSAWAGQMLLWVYENTVTPAVGPSSK